MKRILLVAALIAAATGCWSDTLLTEPQMRIYTGIRTANSWLGVGLCMMGIGMIAMYPVQYSLYLTGDATLYYVAAGVASAGLLMQVVTTTSIGIGSIRLSTSIAKEGSDAPRPTGIATWSLLSAGSMVAAIGSVFVITSAMYTSDPYSVMGMIVIPGILELTSLIAAGVTYFSVKSYGTEIDWREYRARQHVAGGSSGYVCLLPAPCRSGRPALQISIPLLNISY